VPQLTAAHGLRMSCAQGTLGRAGADLLAVARTPCPGMKSNRTGDPRSVGLKTMCRMHYHDVCRCTGGDHLTIMIHLVPCRHPYQRS
jgi:hypothetical protein